MSIMMNTFQNNLITVVVKSLRVPTGGTKGNTNLMLVGTLLNDDEEYLYLGQEGDDEIYAAIKKDDVAVIISGDFSAQDEMMDTANTGVQ